MLTRQWVFHADTINLMTFDVQFALEHGLLELKSEIHSTSFVLFGKELEALQATSDPRDFRTIKKWASISPHMSHVKT
jgi:hypothetical protein